jgi:hypothetical protein
MNDDTTAEPDIPMMDSKPPRVSININSGEAVVREVWDMLRYLDDKADRIGDICRLDEADLESLRYANEQLDHAENIIGSMRNQIERPILESED